MTELTFNCSYCGVKIEADSTLAGKIIQCPKCSHAVKVSEGLMRGGMVLGGYTLEKLLGKGGMGEVWLAMQASTGRKVGLKILAHGLSKDPEFIARFNQEMKLVAKLDHPGIVSAYEAGYDKGFYFLATSYVNGATLESKIDSGKIFGEKEALSIAGKVAEALKYAWDKHRILHRDIKPANIMVDDNGDVKLMDMGISKSLVEDKSITMTGSILGTPYYMSSEQAKADKDIDHRADIYSLGATLYHMLTGSLPYNATTSMGVLARMISENATPARKLNPKISAKCEKLIAKMMNRDKTRRQGTWQEVIDEIERAMDDRIPEEEFSGLNGKSKMITSLAVLLVIASAAVLLIFLIVKKDRNESAYPEISVEDISPERGYASNNQDSRKLQENKKPDEIVALADGVGKRTSGEKPPASGNSVNNVKKSGVASSDSFDDLKPGGVPISEEVQGSALKKDETARIPSLKKTLSENLGISEEKAVRLLPIIKAYGRDLKQLRDNTPPAGYKFNDLREKIHFITMNAKKQSETVLTREQSYKFVQFLEQERRQSFRNNFWRNPGTGTGGK
ncbi:MAG: serine/threonine-protein kinase [Victivallales bacterium]|jgi:serine/threonine-protein kinase